MTERSLERGSWVVSAALVVSVGVLALMTLAARRAGHHGLPALADDPGPVVHVAVTVARLVVDLSATMTVGSLAFVVLCTAPRQHPQFGLTLSHRAYEAMQWTWRWGELWAVSALASLFLSAAMDAGIPLSQPSILHDWWAWRGSSRSRPTG